MCCDRSGRSNARLSSWHRLQLVMHTTEVLINSDDAQVQKGLRQQDRKQNTRLLCIPRHCLPLSGLVHTKSVHVFQSPNRNRKQLSSIKHNEDKPAHLTHMPHCFQVYCILALQVGMCKSDYGAAPMSQPSFKTSSKAAQVAKA